jgi:hypothetical protein
MFNATFNNISVISWWSVLLVEETGVPRENHDLSQVTYKLYHIMLLKMGAFVFCTWSVRSMTLAVLAPSNQLVNMFAEKGLLKVQSIVIFQ